MKIQPTPEEIERQKELDRLKMLEMPFNNFSLVLQKKITSSRSRKTLVRNSTEELKPLKERLMSA